MGPREVLNKLKWGGALQSARVTILHRGATNDKRVIDGTCRGERVVEFGSPLFDLLGQFTSKSPDHILGSSSEHAESFCFNEMKLARYNQHVRRRPKI